MTKYISNRGYTIIKSAYPTQVINDVKRELIAHPFVNPTYAADIEDYPVFMENGTKLYMPKMYGIEKFGDDAINKMPDGVDININFNISLRPNQLEVADIMLDAYKSVGSGILSLHTGWGKTILAIYLIAQLKKRTLVIVNKDSLLTQWKERIMMAAPNATIGIIQQNKFNIDADIVLGMLQSIAMRTYELNAFESFGHVIIDECHHIPSRVFSQALFKVNCKYMLGLSATPQRKDGLTKVIKWFIGDIVHEVSQKLDEEAIIDKVIISSDLRYANEIIDYRGNVSIAKMMSNIVECNERTKILTDLLLDKVKLGYKILVLSDRIQLLKNMLILCQQHHNFFSVGLYVGSNKKNLKQVETCQLILGTYSMASEGLDIPALNCLMLATSKPDIVQSIGRIFRRKHDLMPCIIDIVDDFSVFKNQGIKRTKIYKQRKYEINEKQIII